MSGLNGIRQSGLIDNVNCARVLRHAHVRALPGQRKP